MENENTFSRFFFSITNCGGAYVEFCVKIAQFIVLYGKLSFLSQSICSNSISYSSHTLGRARYHPSSRSCGAGPQFAACSLKADPLAQQVPIGLITAPSSHLSTSHVQMLAHLAYLFLWFCRLPDILSFSLQTSLSIQAHILVSTRSHSCSIAAYLSNLIRPSSVLFQRRQ